MQIFLSVDREGLLFLPAALLEENSYQNIDQTVAQGLCQGSGWGVWSSG